MSTQLILYPQNYVGVYDISYAYGFNEYITNGQNFIGLNQTTDEAISATGLVSQQAIYQLGAITPGAWYRFHTIGPTWNVTTAPTKQAGNVLFPITSTGTIGKSGLLQRMDNLTVGVVYKISIKNAAPLPNGTIRSVIYQLNGNLIAFTDFVNPMYLTYTHTFVAQATSMIYAVTYESSVQTHVIKTISIEESTAVQIGIESIDDGQVICDLYQEEDIPLTLSVDEFKNVAEQVKSYSKDFNLPATKRNNQIFNNMFEVTRNDDGIIFNPYVKTKCVLKQDGFILFEGFLRMTDIKDDEGEISYNVNLYSEVIALAETLESLTFAQLDFTELEHDYNTANITDSWDNVLSLLNPLPAGTYAGTPGASVTSVLKYPNIDWNHQFSLDASNNPVLPNLESMFRPCIQLKYLINQIFGNTIFSWTSNFFDSADFGELYMDFNWGGNNAPITFNSSGELVKFGPMSLTSSYQTLKLYDLNGVFPDSFGYDPTTGIFTAIVDGQMYTADYRVEIDLHPLAPLGSYDLDIEVMVNGVVNYALYNQSVNFSGYTWQPGMMTIGPLAAGDTIYVRMKCPDGSLKLIVESNLSPASGVFTTTSDKSTDETLLETLRGELGQWDFLKGIMTMFNLVSMADPSEKNNIIIEPYADVFVNPTVGTNLVARNIEHDWTDKIDVSEMELKPLLNLNKITKFQFTEDEDDYVFNVYKRANYGHLYGSYSFDASLSSQGLPTSLEGKEEIVVEPFAATVSKPLMSQYSDFIIPSIYAMTDDGTSEEFENLPRIFYNNGKKTLTSCTYEIPAQNGGAGIPFATEILQFSHLTDIPTISATTQDFVFKSEGLIGLGAPPVNNLYSVYWQPYFDELYNADTRLMTLKVNLSPTDVANFKFTEKVFIKNSLFRVNKIEYKPNDLAKVEFIRLP
jgi:hypothetical protein